MLNALTLPRRFHFLCINPFHLPEPYFPMSVTTNKQTMADFWRKGAFFILVLISHRTCAEPTSDKQALLDFISGISHHGSRINWDSSIPACNWTGVICDSDQTRVYGLRLPGVGLVGQIPNNTIGRLTELRVLSLRHNQLYGSLPSDFGNLTSLKSLFLKDNQLSGPFPDSLTWLSGLIRLDISNNLFQGEIPESINNLFLETLFLQNNRFSGNIPSISDLSGFNASNNNFTGQIPETLSKFPPSSFDGNLLLCGKPLPPCSTGPSPSPSSGSHHAGKLSTGAIVGIVVGAVVALLLILLLILCFCKRKRHDTEKSQTEYTAEIARASFTGESSSSDMLKQRLVFFQGNNIYGFDLNDLLKASAEVLGTGTTGTSYMAEMDVGTTLAVKRLKEVVVGKTEMESQLALVGQLRHENLVKLIAYYYSNDEKLLVSQYIPGGSLSSLLHGNRLSGRPPLDWKTRFRIGLTAARGLLYVHMAANMPHGNFKSSNILITKSLEACISDYGMHSLFGASPAPNRVTGYRAPEVQQQPRMISFKSDVYSFGVVLLEMLTGKAPCQVASVGEDSIDLPRWVKSVSAAEVFDAVVVGAGVEEEMVAVLQVAMKCVELMPESRPDMVEVVRMLEMVENGEFQSPLDPKWK